jgi:chromosome segregation ATPase
MPSKMEHTQPISMLQWTSVMIGLKTAGLINFSSAYEVKAMAEDLARLQREKADAEAALRNAESSALQIRQQLGNTETERKLAEQSLLAVKEVTAIQRAQATQDNQLLRDQLAQTSGRAVGLEASTSVLHKELEQQRRHIQEIASSFPSLEKRGLWEQGRPSARVLAMARELGEVQLDDDTATVMESDKVPQIVRAQLAELVDQVNTKLLECESMSKLVDDFDSRYGQAWSITPNPRPDPEFVRMREAVEKARKESEPCKAGLEAKLRATRAVKYRAAEFLE